ncbi:hypothetical protein Y88_2485 [Novosphingobium nitrogenifigens DSM 19370]|uniref:DUF1345 domain-containing protein n=1 Tax=Novosphingobium nitrogenifigens DSM 19370 TaxID=983920 RepID=F1Z6P1_9SPHN|nr:DUF1345 domain-containing protein [Novosphingobium nitrogenifigens]EGD59701.1 hypothetical protein Y88_2485 [Novosphingobium nitrogenifigens DSM 19370]
MARRPGKPSALGGWLAPARFLGFLVLFPASALGWHWGGHGLADSIDMGFDAAALMFLVSLLPLILREQDAASIRRYASANDANRLAVLAITSSLTLVVMAAIAGELPKVGQGEPHAMVKLIATLILTWLFANAVYALHYAHLYYLPGKKPGQDAGGLDFPGTEYPDYLDFVYFAFTLGMTFQTADVCMTGRPIRRIAILHGFAAFIFNIGVIAFTINALGGAGGH